MEKVNIGRPPHGRAGWTAAGAGRRPVARGRHAYAGRVQMQVVLVTAGLAVLVVVVAAVAFRWSERESRVVATVPAREIPDGVSTVLSVLRSAAIVVDVADEVVKATPAAYAMGLVRGAYLSQEPLVEMVRSVRRDGQILDRELEVSRGPLGPGTLVVQARVAPLGGLHVLLLVEDRTEARRLEEVRRDFVVNVSHELKTPVGAIGLLAETMSAAADDPEAVRRFAGRMEREADRLAALVQEIIDLSRLQVSAALAKPVLVEVDDVLAEAVDRARLAADTRGISIEVGGRTGTRVYGDHALLVTAVRNLVDNAVRYSPDRTHIGIGVSRGSEGGDGGVDGDRDGPPGSWRSPSRTRASASRRTSRAGSSSGSTASTRRARGRPEAPAWA